MGFQQMLRNIDMENHHNLYVLLVVVANTLILTYLQSQQTYRLLYQMFLFQIFLVVMICALIPLQIFPLTIPSSLIFYMFDMILFLLILYLISDAYCMSVHLLNLVKP